MAPIELRWFISKSRDEPVKGILQYRSLKHVTDYSTNDQISKNEWTTWRDVPEVKDGVDSATEE